MKSTAALVNDSYNQLTQEELTNIGITLGAYRSFRGNRRKHIAYISMPITSGKRYYDILEEYNCKDTDELSKKIGQSALYDLVIKPNILEGIEFADDIGMLNKDLLYIAPSVFEAKKWHWTQDAYMALWYRVLGEMAGTHVLMDGWEYSTGGVKEVAMSVLMQNKALWHKQLKEFHVDNFFADIPREKWIEEAEAMSKIKIYDTNKEELNIIAVLHKIADAIEDLRVRGFSYQGLIKPANHMMSLIWRGCFTEYPHSSEWREKYFEAHQRIRNIQYADQT